jgi:ATP-dependent DNA ligase
LDRESWARWLDVKHDRLGDAMQG